MVGNEQAITIAFWAVFAISAAFVSMVCVWLWRLYQFAKKGEAWTN